MLIIQNVIMENNVIKQQVNVYKIKNVFQDKYVMDMIV